MVMAGRTSSVAFAVLTPVAALAETLKSSAPGGVEDIVVSVSFTSTEVEPSRVILLEESSPRSRRYRGC